MEAKKIIKKLFISSIIGIILGIITEYALILNIKWLILITQSFIFWGLIICMMAFLSKDYIFSIANPMITITLMNITYYVIRLIKSGHTNTDGLVLFAVMGIAGSIYNRYIYSYIKEKGYIASKRKLLSNMLFCFYDCCRNNLTCNRFKKSINLYFS